MLDWYSRTIKRLNDHNLQPLIVASFRLIFTPGRMASGAIRQFLLADTFFEMLTFGFGRVVLVAVVAGVLRISGRVAGFAGNFALTTMIEREDMLA